MKRFPLVMLLLLLLLAACGGAAQESSSPPTASDVVEEAAEAPAMEGEAAGGDTAGSTGGPPPAAQGPALTRRIIYTADLDLRVDDPRDTAMQLQGLARQFGGYVSGANIYEYGDDVYRGTVQLRVQSEQFDAALAALRGLATEVLNEQLDSQDVTDQYVDLEARIENLERTESELQALLTEARERGGNTEDIISVYRELTSVREQIEVYQGQLNVLADAVTLATINVELVPPEVPVEVLDEGWSPMRTARRSLRALTEGLQGLTDFVIVFTITVLPFLLLLALLGFLALSVLRWLVRRRPTPPRTPPAPTTTSE